jgi:hypothetical protein
MDQLYNGTSVPPARVPLAGEPENDGVVKTVEFDEVAVSV